MKDFFIIFTRDQQVSLLEWVLSASRLMQNERPIPGPQRVD